MNSHKKYLIVATIALIAVVFLINLGVFTKLVSVLTSSASVCIPAPGGIVGWWQGEGDASDGIGGNDGVFRNGATTVPGKVGQGFGFDGGDDFVEVEGGVDIAGKSFTWMAWLKRNSSGTLDIVFNQGGAFQNNGLSIGFLPNNRFLFGFYSNDLITGATYTDPDWHFWAGTYNAATNERILYRDSVEISKGVASEDYLGAGNLTIGTIPWVSTGGFDGIVDEVVFFDRVVSVKDIQSIYGAGDGGMCVPACGNSQAETVYNEQCDDGNAFSLDGCSNSCKFEYCSDGVVQSSIGVRNSSGDLVAAGINEQCDDGNSLNGDGCSTFCQLEGVGGGGGVSQEVLDAIIASTTAQIEALEQRIDVQITADIQSQITKLSLAFQKLFFKPDINNFLAQNCLDLKLAETAPDVASQKQLQDSALSLLGVTSNRGDDYDDSRANSKVRSKLEAASSALARQKGDYLAKANELLVEVKTELIVKQQDFEQAVQQLQSITLVSMSDQVSSVRVLQTILDSETTAITDAQNALAAGDSNTAQTKINDAIEAEKVFTEDVHRAGKLIGEVDIGKAIQDDIKLSCAKALPRENNELPLGVKFDQLNPTEQQEVTALLNSIKKSFLELFF